jgi:hypothetical protein
MNAREYYLQNRERIRAQQKAYKASARGAEVNRRCSASWYRSAAARGVVTWRLKPPRSLASWSGRLRWRTTLRSTNGELVVASVWELMELFGDGSRIRFRERMLDRDMSREPGAKWLREHSC